AINERVQILLACWILIALMVQSSSSPVIIYYQATMSPLGSSSISYVMSRGEAYYVTAIPAPDGPNLLRFDWNVSVSYTGTGQGSIQFSHDNSTWSNLASYYLVLGEAQGKQSIDSSWALSGTNYLRASYNQSFSEISILKVYVNYAFTILAVLSPFISVGIVGASIYFVRKRDRQSVALTT